MAPRLRVALIGTNFGGSVQVPGFRLLEGVQLVAIASARLERARALAAAEDIPYAFDDYRRMLDEVEVDLVSIATPVYLHYEMVLEAALRGVHILCEKPLALSVGQAEEMLAAVNATRLPHGVDFEFRYYRGLATLKRAIDAGYLGEPRMARVVWRSDVRSTAEKVPYTWWSERKQGGGVLGAVASHWIDALRWWFGEPRDVTSQLNTFVPQRGDASGTLRPVTSEDTAHLAMRLGSSGVQATIDVSMAVGPGGGRLELYGTDAALVLDGFDEVHLLRSGSGAEPLPLASERFALQPDQPINVPAFAALVADLRGTILGEAPPERVPDFDDGIAVQRVLDIAYQQEAERAIGSVVSQGQGEPE
jgi:predicted dehydrogenase